MKMWIITLLGTAAVGYGLTRLPAFIVGWFKVNIQRAFDAGDDADDKLLVAICAWADEKISRLFPSEQSDAPYEAAARWCVDRLPVPARALVKIDKLAKAIKEIVIGLRKILDERGA